MSILYKPCIEPYKCIIMSYESVSEDPFEEKTMNHKPENKQQLRLVPLYKTHTHEYTVKMSHLSSFPLLLSNKQSEYSLLVSLLSLNISLISTQPFIVHVRQVGRV